MVLARFNLNTIKEAGLRYIVVNRNGLAWAHELMPERSDGFWIPNRAIRYSGTSGETYHEYWTRMLRDILGGREYILPVGKAPFHLTWEDEPYDLVEHEVLSEGELKKWQ